MTGELSVVGEGDRWRLVGDADVALINDYLDYLTDRNYSPRTVRAYAFDLLHFARWLLNEGGELDAVGTETLLAYLAANRRERLPGQHDNVVSLHTGRSA